VPCTLKAILIDVASTRTCIARGPVQDVGNEGGVLGRKEEEIPSL